MKNKPKRESALKRKDGKQKKSKKGTPRVSFGETTKVKYPADSSVKSLKASKEKTPPAPAAAAGKAQKVPKEKKSKPVKKEKKIKEKHDKKKEKAQKAVPQAKPAASAPGEGSVGPRPPHRLSGKTKVDDSNAPSTDSVSPSPRRELFGDATSGLASPAVSTASIKQLKDEAKAAGLSLEAYMEEISRQVLEDELEKRMMSLANGENEDVSDEEGVGDDEEKDDGEKESDEKRKPEKKEVAKDDSSVMSSSDSDNDSDGDDDDESDDEGSNEEEEEDAEATGNEGSDEEDEPESDNDDSKSDLGASTTDLVKAVEEHLDDVPQKANKHQQVAVAVSSQQQNQRPQQPQTSGNAATDGISPEYANANSILQASVNPNRSNQL